MTWDTQSLRKESLLVLRTSCNEGKSTSNNKKTIGKKPYKPVYFICHKVGHTANVCRSRSSSFNGYRYNAYEGYKPKTFNGYFYTCNKYGHRDLSA